MAVDSASSVPEALPQVVQGHEEAPTLENLDHDQEEQARFATLLLEEPTLENLDHDQEEQARFGTSLLWHLALSSVFFNIYCKLTACEPQHSLGQEYLRGFDKLKRTKADSDHDLEVGVDESSGKVDLQTIIELRQSNELDLERRNQGKPDVGELRWPFLLRFPITVYGITLGLGSHAVMWKNIASLSPVHAEHVPRVIGAIFWIICLLHLLFVTLLYSIKLVRWPKAVRLEFQHPVRSNFFAAPFISALFLILGYSNLTPGFVTESTQDQQFVWNVWAAFVFTALLLLYEIHIYGRWLLSRAHKLSEIANPTTQIAVIGNFVSASAFALAGWKEVSLFLFTVGAMHQLVVFNFIFSRFTSDHIISVQLRPTYFLFVAPPSVASIAWSHIHGAVDNVTAILTFTAVFFVVIMVSRVQFFFKQGARFSLTWWAFTFPSAAISMSVMNYESGRSPSQYLFQMNHFDIPRFFSFSFVLFSILLLVGVSLCTIIQAMSGQIFVNDLVVEPALLFERNEGGHQTRNRDICI